MKWPFFNLRKKFFDIQEIRKCDLKEFQRGVLKFGQNGLDKYSDI